MTKRIVVAGSRYFEDYDVAKQYIQECISDIKKDNELVFLSGMCKWADLLGEKFAKENGYDMIVDSSMLAFAKDSYDVTDKILKIMNVDPAKRKELKDTDKKK